MELAKILHPSNQIALTKQQLKEEAANYADIMQKTKEMQKMDSQRIEALLTPQQFMTFKKIYLKQAFLRNLISSWQIGSGDFGKEIRDIFDRINATQEQIEKMRRLYEENDMIVRQKYIDMGKIIIKLLSPEQQQNLFESLDPSDDSSDAAESKPMTKNGVGSLAVSGSAAPADAAKSLNEKQSPTKSGVGMLTVGSFSADAPAKEQASGGGAAVPGTLAAPADFINLPAYWNIGAPEYRKQLDITSEQENKLREISHTYVSERNNLNGEKEINKKLVQLASKCRKQMEEVLTPQQIDAYKKDHLTFDDC